MSIIYVGAFQLAARVCHPDQIWKGLRKVIDMDKEVVGGRFLGCTYETFKASAEDVKELLENQPQYHPRPHLTAKSKRDITVAKSPAECITPNTKHLWQYF